jgi:hypothetical protein
MLLIGAIRLYRSLRGVVGFSFARLVFWPSIALGVAWGGGFLIEALAGGLPIEVLALKLGIFTVLFGGFLLALERNDLAVGVRWVQETVWRKT